MNRIIIVDHSLYNLQGHHYECSLAVAEAAQRAGYQPIILANRAFRRSLAPQGIEVIPIFAVDWFDQPIETSQAIEAVSPEITTIQSPTLPHPLIQLFLEKVFGSTTRLKSWIKRDLALLRFIPGANTTWGLLKIVWGVIQFMGSMIDKILMPIIQKILPTVPLNTTPNPPILNQPQRFIETWAKILPTLNLTGRDHVFIHTIGIPQLEDLYYFLTKNATENSPIYHILLRRHPQESFIVNTPGLGLKGCLNAFADSQLWPSKIRFYTDTEELVNQHNALSPVRLTQIPIPFRQEKLAVVTPTVNHPLKVVYLGDARSEKGFHHLPYLVMALWDDYLAPEKIQLIIQSNYNIQGGEPGILEAKLTLASYPSQNVKLINEAMSADQYYSLLVSADLVILPYNPQSYQRTSGVLTEALAAGKPVVVPAGSWLAQQVDETRARIYENPQDFPQSVIDAIANLESLTHSAQQFKDSWCASQSPDRLLQILLSPPPQEVIHIQPNTPRILVILAGHQLLMPNHRFQGKVLRSLCESGYQVSLVVYGLADLGETVLKEVQLSLRYLGLNQVWLLSDELRTQGDRLGASWQEDWLNYQQVLLPETLTQLIQDQKFDLVWFDSPLCYRWLKDTNIPVIAEIDQLASYESAKINQREIDGQELEKEIKILKQCRSIVTRSPGLAAKLEELTQKKEVYAWQEKENLQSVNSDKVANFYHHQLEQILSQAFGSQALPLKQTLKTQKIAILYPWGDIEERRSGASQRTGLMLDYLKEQDYEIHFYTLGKTRSFWSDGVYSEYYEPYFEQADLVKQVYQDAYRSWTEDFALIKGADKTPELEQNEHWLPWIYYQFRFDPNFQHWLNQITDWADVIILEYPFWGYLLGKLCQQKSVKLFITAHDVLAKNLPLDTALGQISLGEELQALKQADEVITLTPDDQQFFVKYGISSHCVPIGIDTQKIEMTWQDPPITFSLEIWHTQRDSSRPFCLFVGSQHPPNIEAVKQIQKWSQMADLPFDFVVVGSCWAIEWQKTFLALGKVSETDLIYLYHQAALVIAPLTLGTGMSVKTLEAMAYGKAMLGTTIAFRGYPIQAGVNAWVEDQLEAYPERINNLLQQPEQLKAIGQQARKFAKNYDYRALYCTYEELLTPQSFETENFNKARTESTT